MGVTRRDFLMRVGQAGGYAAAFATMQSLGLLPMKGEIPMPIAAEPGSGKGTKVVVLGAGIGGLVSAYELKKLGYEVTLLEARERPGGRNWTGRKGTKVEFVDGTTQTIEWEEGNYQNLGPARLPSTHWTMLGYCRELGVPLFSTAVSREMLSAARGQGLGERDFAIMYYALANAAGLRETPPIADQPTAESTG